MFIGYTPRVSEIGYLCLALIVVLPLCIMGLGISHYLLAKSYLKHLEETQVIGGTPRKIQEFTLAQRMHQLQKAKPDVKRVMS